MKHCVHGLHCVHIRSLPVSAMPRTVTGGVPIDTFMRYSPSLGMILDWIGLDVDDKDEDESKAVLGLNRSMRENERRKALRRRSESAAEGL